MSSNFQQQNTVTDGDSDDTDTTEKRKFPNGDVYHTGACQTVRANTDKGFRSLSLVSETRRELKELEHCGRCQEANPPKEIDTNEQSVPSPDSQTTRVTVRIPNEQLAQIEQKVDEGDAYNRCELIREAIANHLDD